MSDHVFTSSATTSADAKRDLYLAKEALRYGDGESREIATDVLSTVGDPNAVRLLRDLLTYPVSIHRR